MRKNVPFDRERTRTGWLWTIPPSATISQYIQPISQRAAAPAGPQKNRAVYWLSAQGL